MSFGVVVEPHKCTLSVTEHTQRESVRTCVSVLMNMCLILCGLLPPSALRD